MDKKLIDDHAEMEGEPIPTKRGWYYVSKTRKHGRNKLWAGPFLTDQAAVADADAVAAKAASLIAIN